MAADVVGYSRLMGIDEEGTLSALKAVRRDLLDVKIGEHNGRMLRTMGDGFLVEFPMAADAVQCALEVQRAMPGYGAAIPAERRIRLRIAVDAGNVVGDGELVHGDGVAVAARMESLAEPGGINVSRAVHDEICDRLPVVFRDLGEHRVAHIGRPVQVFRIVLDRPAGPPGARLSLPARPSRPGLAVLPFQNLGGGADEDFFLDSVAEDLITELARARWFAVMARNTSFGYKGASAHPKEVGRELGVRYLVEGSLRKAGERVRISCRLVEAEDGRQLWAERFDGTLDDSFDLQDRITESVIGSAGPVLRLAEIERARRKPQTDLDVYDLTLRALPDVFAETAEANAAALPVLERGLALDPAYPTANALAAWCRQQRHLMSWPGVQPDDRETARRLARTAIAEGADVPLALAVAGAVQAVLGREHDLAVAAIDRAVTLNPNAAVVLGFDALTRCLCGDYARAAEHAEKAQRLGLVEPLVYHASLALALARLLTDDPEAAIEPARQATEGNRNFAFAHCVLAICLARCGRAGEAADAVRRLQPGGSGFGLAALRGIRFADAARLLADLDLLKAAGLPE